jgi:hypothetical protein
MYRWARWRPCTLEYPAHVRTAVITTCGRICYQRRKINVSQVFAGQKVGVEQVDEHSWLVTSMHDDLGYFDDESCRLEPADNLFATRSLKANAARSRSRPSTSWLPSWAVPSPLICRVECDSVQCG